MRYIELGDDGYAMRQVDEFENGYLTRYDRNHWYDQYGSLADFHFGPAWVEHWGSPSVISSREFEDKWARASKSPVVAMKQPSPQSPPPWLRA